MKTQAVDRLIGGVFEEAELGTGAYFESIDALVGSLVCAIGEARALGGHDERSLGPVLRLIRNLGMLKAAIEGDICTIFSEYGADTMRGLDERAELLEEPVKTEV